MRVQLKSVITSVWNAGIIPACAGTTSFKRSFLLSVRDHPRVCGYNAELIISLTCFSGSSPRVRVQLIFATIVFVLSGIIPACAGTTFYLTYDHVFLWDHPRVCGYNFKYSDFVSEHLGSSPRVRVQLKERSDEEIANRIIPACAGTT